MASITKTIDTPLTDLLQITHPVILAGMNAAAGPLLAAAVSNAGGLGVIGGVTFTPEILRTDIATIKENLRVPPAADGSYAFGIDLALPQVGGNARPTNYDYTKGRLPELIDVIIEERARLFVCAIGVPPQWAVDKLHKAGIIIMNMIGAPKHALKAIAAGVDIVCAQGGEGGGHTGDIATSILIPAVVDACRGHTSKFTGKPVYVVAAGGIHDGRGLAMALSLGAQAAWVGTRFICAQEARAPRRHQEAVLHADYDSTVRTLIYTGRPLRTLKTAYIREWEENRHDDIKRLTRSGVIPVKQDMEERERAGTEFDEQTVLDAQPLLMGQVAGAVKQIRPAAEIVKELVDGAVAQLTMLSSNIRTLAPSKL
ncbi:2-nitropropane dioxygenase [Phlyctochytrium arcticum]|nr:2-nitropropane dioxygenase [Phlyctochytrium arcticum]